MKDIFRNTSPQSNIEFRCQKNPPPQKPKETKSNTPKKEETPKKPVHPAQQPVLGRKKWNPNAPTTYPD